MRSRSASWARQFSRRSMSRVASPAGASTMSRRRKVSRSFSRRHSAASGLSPSFGSRQGQTTRSGRHRESLHPSASRSSGASPAGRGRAPRPRRADGATHTAARVGQSADTIRSRPPRPTRARAPRPRARDRRRLNRGWPARDGRYCSACDAVNRMTGADPVAAARGHDYDIGVSALGP